MFSFSPSAHLEAAESEGTEAGAVYERRADGDVSGAEKAKSRGDCGRRGGAVEEKKEEDEGCAGGLHADCVLTPGNHF